MSPMSQVQTQTPKTQAPGIYTVLPIYTRYELELRLLWLNEKLKELDEKCRELEKIFIEVNDILLKLKAREAFRRLVYAMNEVMKVCRDKYNIVVDSLGGNTVLLKEDEAIKPATITIDHDHEVWYNEWYND